MVLQLWASLSQKSSSLARDARVFLGRRLMNHTTGKEVVYTLVAEHEASLREGKLAIGTPIAQALLGHKKGDKVEVSVPAGKMLFEVLDISI